MSAHRIVKDRTGSGYERLACEPCNATLVRQPWHSDLLWEAKRRTWELQHAAGDRKA